MPTADIGLRAHQASDYLVHASIIYAMKNTCWICVCNQVMVWCESGRAGGLGGVDTHTGAQRGPLWVTSNMALSIYRYSNRVSFMYSLNAELLDPVWFFDLLRLNILVTIVFILLCYLMRWKLVCCTLPQYLGRFKHGFLFAVNAVWTYTLPREAPI